MTLRSGILVVLLAAWAGGVLPAAAAPEAPAPQDIPEEMPPGSGFTGQQDVPRDPQDPGEDPPPARRPCGETVRVHNRTADNLRIIYVTEVADPLVFEVPKESASDVGPIYCPSQLVVLTGDKEESVEVDPTLSYEVVWSEQRKLYLIQAL